MKEPENLLESLSGSSGKFIELQQKSIRLKFYQKLTGSLTSVAQLGILAAFAIIAYLFLNVALSFTLGKITGSITYGFLISGVLNILFFCIYAFNRKRIGHSTLQNTILRNISGTYSNYEVLTMDLEKTEAELAAATIDLKNDLGSLKKRITELQQQVQKLKDQISGNGSGEGNGFARSAITTTVEVLLNTFVLKNAGILKRTLVPVIANAFVTSKLFGEKKKSSLIENLKLKAMKLFR
jgi:hypothetical protein